MHHASFVCSLALCIAGVEAFRPFHPKSLPHVEDAEKRDAVARDTAGAMGFVTFKMAKVASSVSTHSLHGRL